MKPVLDKSVNKSRIAAFDGFRGVAIVAVVAAHTAGLGWEFQSAIGGQLNFAFSLVIRNLASYFPLPMFLICSGYWLAKVKFSGWNTYVEFLQKRVSRIAIPYLFWSMILLGVQAFRSGDYSTITFVKKLILGQADGPYYFILLMLQFYLVAPLFVRWSQRGSTLAWLILIHFLVIVGIYYLRIALYPSLSYTVVKLPLLTWLSFFPIGMWLRSHPETADSIGIPVLTGSAVGLIGLGLAESFMLISKGPLWVEFAISDIRFPALLFSVVMSFIFFQYRQRHWPKFLTVLGEYSFGIFLIHGFLLRGLARGVRMVDGLFELQPVYQFIVLLTTLILSCAIICVTRRLLGRVISARLLGF